MKRESEQRGWRSAVSSRAKTTIVAVNCAAETSLKNFGSRRATAARGGVCGAGVVSNLTGVKPPGVRLAAVVRSAAETTVLKAGPPNCNSFAPQARRPQLRVVPRAAGPPSEQRREHGGKVRRLKACPRLAQDSSALTLIIDARNRWIEEYQPALFPTEPRRETKSMCYLPRPGELFHRLSLKREFALPAIFPDPFRCLRVGSCVLA
jgi:hypothetical protein